MASLPFSVLDGNLTDVRLDVKGGVGWGSVPRIKVDVISDTGRVRKVRQICSTDR